MPFLETGGFHPIDARSLKLIQNPGFWAASLASLTLSATPSLAQIAGDGSLGTQVNGNPTTPCTGTCLVTDGSTRGQNLFHSLQQFSLPNSTDLAGFLTAPGIQNVIVRVTGAGQPFISTINGTIFTLNETLSAISPVNLFLINPNGIIFGPNARLNVGGSFVATTLDAITFPGGQAFSATNPGNANSLLTIVGDPSGFLASQRTPKDITVQNSALGVYPGQSLLLLGGNVTLDNVFLGFFNLPGQGGRIELAGIAGEGSIGLTTGQNELRLAIPNNIARADIAIRNGSTLETASVGGSLTFTARNLDISGGSRLGAGRFSSTIDSLNQIGNLTFNTAEILSIREESSIGNFIDFGASGRSGNINVETGALLITGGSSIGNRLSGTGDIGDLQIKVRDRIVGTGSV
jgi:filamentous hemagglutinin family protein